jgi:flavin reductase (DIM6/NTAB) family NADH-FMN oxidoreductase RutF
LLVLDLAPGEDMTIFEKSNYPLIDVRRHLETGPIVLVSSAWKGETNIMTMGWHMMMQFSPALFGCYIWAGNHSYDLIRNSQECVINIPTIDLASQVVAVGNSTGDKIDKFSEFGLTPVKSDMVNAPLIKECYANFECQLSDSNLVGEYGLFIWEVVMAHVAISVRNPKTLHYQGEFMVAGDKISFREDFKPQNL